MLTLGSICSGIGGLELGLELVLGCKTIWQCESDPYCQAVLKRHWPEADIYPDLKELNSPPYVDIICGGTPCQDLSVAGEGRGIIEGARSSLFFDFVRVVRQVRPRFVVWENVEGAVSRALWIVLWELAKLGYDLEWRVLRASDVGAPHNRPRIFVLGWLADAEGEREREPPDQAVAIPDLGGEGAVTRGGGEPPVADPDGEWALESERLVAELRRWASDGGVGALEAGPMADAEVVGLRQGRGPQRGPEELSESGGGGEDAADELADADRSVIREQPVGVGGGGGPSQSPVSGEEVGNADIKGLEVGRCEPGDSRPKLKAFKRTGRRSAVSRVVRAADGLPHGLDRGRFQWPAVHGFWPHDRSGGGPEGPPPQYWWESPRTVLREPRLPNRVARLKALGNAVVPICACIVGLRLREICGRGGSGRGQA